MITKLTIENFKSIKSLTMDCRRVNVFIGEPNTGKSNILEALGLLSWCGAPDEQLSSYIRMRGATNLFYDEVVDGAIVVHAAGDPAVAVSIEFEKGDFVICEQGNSGRRVLGRLTPDGQPVVYDMRSISAERIKLYKFDERDTFEDSRPETLVCPNGQNLFSVVYTSRTLRKRMQDFFEPYGLTVVMKPQEKRFEVQKNADGVIVSYPYALTADTLQRVIFYTMAMASNKDSVLVFEEPESNAFPYYTKQMGEQIGFDAGNQYFIATHNPYLLHAIVEKGKREDVNVAITYFRDYQTHVKCLSQDQLCQLLDADPFFNLSAFLEEGAPA